MDERTDQAAKDKVVALVKSVDFALLTTRSADDGAMHSRPMAWRSIEPDGQLWFFSKGASRKVAELRADPNVTVSFADPRHQNFVTITGQATVVEDRDVVEARWLELYRPWFPGGPQDPAVVAIRIDAEHAEYWDNPTNPLVYAFGYVRAVATGKAAKPGDVGAVKLG